jgi:hypothetical protein
MVDWRFISFIEDFFKRIKTIEIETDDQGNAVFEYECSKILSISAPALIQFICQDNKLYIKAYSIVEMEEKWILKENDILAHYHVFKPVKTKIRIVVK